MLRFADSFLHLATADYTTSTKWTTLFPGRSGSTQNSIVAAANRWGGQCIQFNTGNQGGGLQQQLDAQNTWYMGAAVRFTGFAGTPDQAFFAIADNGTVQMQLLVNTSGNILLWRGVTQVAVGTTALTAGVWYYIEFGIYPIHSSTGLAKVRINEVDEITFSGNTQSSGNATANQILIGGINHTAQASQVRMGDFAVCDGQASSSGAADFMGDIRVECLYPSGDGNSSQFTGSDGNSINNSLLVDEAVQNGDTDYVESNTLNQKDTYAMGDLVTSQATIYGVQPVPFVRKTDAGTRKVVSVARLSATEVDSAEKVLAVGYACLPDVRETKPGGGAWAVSDVNSAEFGMKVST